MLGDLGAALSPYPFALVFPQEEHERLLIEQLAALGVVVERGYELASFEESGSEVRARLKRPDGGYESVQTAYIAGCDGAHSAVRTTLGIGFRGGTYDHLFYVADVQAAGAVVDGNIHVALDSTDFLAIFARRQAGAVRLVGTVRDEAIRASPEQLSWEDVGRRVMGGQSTHLPLKVNAGGVIPRRP